MANSNEWRRRKIAEDPDYRFKHARSVRDANLRRKYGMTIEEYEARVAEQDGVCAICGRPDPKRDLAVDHDHVTGATRGLLCAPCNRGLGQFADSTELLRAAAVYLEEHASRA